MEPVKAMGVNFVAMALEHIDEILAIEQVSFPTPWSRQAFYYEVTENQFAHYLVALVGGQVAGYGGMWLVLDEAHVTNIAIHPAYRGQGLGKELLAEMIRRAAFLGAKRMTLEVRPSNLTARSLYEKFGFLPCGRRKGYYTDNNEDAIIMWKDPLVEGNASAGL